MSGVAGKKTGCGPFIILAAVVAVVAIIASSHHPDSAAVAPAETAPLVSAPSDKVAAPGTDAVAPVTAEYAPPSASQVAKAGREVQRVFADEGLSGLSHYSQLCFEALTHGGTFGGLDFCLAFDVLSQQVAAATAPSYAQTSGSWFAASDQRDIAAGTAFMAGQGDPAARVADIRALVESYVAEKSTAAPSDQQASAVTTESAPPASSEAVGSAY